MRSHLVLLPLLGALLGGVTASGDAELEIRQADETSSTGGGGGGQVSSTEEEEPPSSTSEQAPPPSSSGGSSPTSSGGDDEDTTVTVTTTVSGDADVVTSATTRETTVVTTVLVTSTIFETRTVTDDEQGVATETVYVTSTIFASDNRRRGLDLPVRTLPLEDVEAVLTAADAEPTPIDIKAAYYEMMRREALPLPAAGLEKRATVTEVVTETEGGDGASTVVNTVTRTVVSTERDETTVTETITETEAANASTTETVTSTLTVTSTNVESGVQTQTESTDGGDSGGGGGGSSDDSGLSTGAIAGIAVGASVAGLAFLGALLWFCLKKRREANKYDADDNLGGGSEVPVGGAGGYSSHNRTPSMSQNLSSSGGAIGETPRREPVLPNLTSPEGYRGTAMGAGRTGYAKTDNYGSSYGQTASNTNTMTSSAVSPYSPTNRSSTLGGDQLPEHPAPGGMTGLAAVGHKGRSVSPYSDQPYAQPPPQHNEPQAAELGSDGGGARWQNQGGAAELGSDGGGARWQNQGAAEIDSQPARRRTSGPLYEMP